MLKFNSNGLLIPDNNILSTVAELENIFVKEIPSARRKELFHKYISYSNSLSELCGGGKLTQWVNGSFVTRKFNPGDIDLVTFIDFTIVEKFGTNLANFKHPACHDIFGVDAYIVKVYPPGHKSYRLYLADKAYWMEHFSRTRRNRIGNKLQKGFLEINM